MWFFRSSPPLTTAATMSCVFGIGTKKRERPSRRCWRRKRQRWVLSIHRILAAQQLRLSQDAVLGMLYNPNNANHVVIYGKNHVIFLQYEAKGRVVKKNGIFGSVDKPKIVTCAAFTPNGDLLTGDSNGTIIGWQQNSNHSNFCITNVHKGLNVSRFALRSIIRNAS